MKATDLNKLSDRDLIAALRVLITAISGNEADYGLIAGDTIGLTADVDAFEAAVDLLDDKRAETSAAKGDRDTSRGIQNEGVRILLKKIRLHIGNDPEKLGAAGLDVYDETPTAAATPTSAPLVLMEYAILKHIVNFRDAATPDKRGKPDGVMGAEIWSKVGGPAPVSDSDFSMVALDTATPYVIHYTMEDAGKHVWYRLRWVTASGEKGGWGETQVATINA